MNAVARPAVLKVSLLDLKPQYQALKSEIDAAIAEVCASQMFILGPAVTELERRVAEYSQAKFAIGLSSGTDALLIALMALDIAAGDEVITSPYTFFATGGTIARVAARPVFVDIEPDTFNISPHAVEEFLTKQCVKREGRLINRQTGGRVRALMPVHLYGQAADMDPLMELAGRFGLRVIEDAAQAIGSEYPRARRVGAIGAIGCLSFFPTKNLGAFGDAGMCTTNDAELAQRLKILRVHGGEPKYYHALIGGNFRIDEIQAAVLNVKLTHLDAWSRGRQENAAFYDAAFRKGGESRIGLPAARAGYRHIYNQYVIRVPKRDAVRKYLADCGVATEIYYPVPLHLQECFAYLGYRQGDMPESERAARETLALPIYPELSREQLAHVVTCTVSAVRANS
ncbi:MAG TPA: DegT/DnrJ/EryC1/StrS family aminotransferase [Steroidobacteraceae bacterium]|nr:DegT/DnrJ/EryC1/StrS family aminotransferase [Steroidobacteraceae bacterium]